MDEPLCDARRALRELGERIGRLPAAYRAELLEPLAAAQHALDVPVAAAAPAAATGGNPEEMPGEGPFRKMAAGTSVEAALTGCERQFRDLVEQLPVAVAEVDENGGYTFVNSRACEVLGYSREELTGGMTFFAFVAPGNQRRATHACGETVTGPQITGPHLYQTTRKDGSLVAVHAYTTAMRVQPGSTGVALRVVFADVTAQERACAAMAESEALHRVTLDAMNDSLHVVGPDLRIQLFNRVFREWCESLDLPRDNIGKHVMQVFPFLPASTEAEYKRVFHYGKPVTTRDTTRVGTKRFVTETGKFPIRENGQVTRVLTVVRDITAREKVEQALRASEARFRTLFDGIPIGMYQTTPDGEVLAANPALLQMLGFPDLETLRKRNVIEGFVNSEDRARWQREMDTNGTVRGFEFAVRRYDDRTVWMRDTGRAVVDADGNILYYEGAIEDITARKHVEDAYAALVENSLQGLVVIQAGRIVFANAACCAMTGYTRNELETMRPENVRAILGDRVRSDRGDGAARFDQQICRKGGARLWVEFFSSDVLYEGQPAVQTAFVDISARKRAEERLRQLGVRLADLQENERHWMARELHDEVGQTLTGLGINLQVLRTQLNPGCLERVSARLRDAEMQVVEIAEHIRNVMTGLRPLVLDDYGLWPALRSYAEGFEARTGIRVELKHCGPHARPVQEVETALYRITQEALTNVVKHAQASRVEIVFELVADRLRLSIIDDGGGFVFEKMQHNAPDPSATGWGLLTMRERAFAVGGEFRVESRPGEGTRVRVDVPAAGRI